MPVPRQPVRRDRQEDPRPRAAGAFISSLFAFWAGRRRSPFLSSPLGVCALHTVPVALLLFPSRTSPTSQHQHHANRNKTKQSLALAHAKVDDADNVLLSAWTETDFRTGEAPWWK